MNFPVLTAIPKAFGDGLARLFAGLSYVQSGLQLTAHGVGSLQIDVAAGTGWVNGVFVNYAGGNVIPGAAGANPRYDLIRIASGAVAPSVIAGAPAAVGPTEPALPAGDLFLGTVFIPPGAVDYTGNAFINDYTVPLTLGAGQAANPALVFAADLVTGIFRAAAASWSVAVSGVERLRITVTQVNAIGAGQKFAEQGNNIQPMTTNGDIPIFAGGVPARLAIGLNPGIGQALVVSGGAPVWKDQALVDPALYTAPLDKLITVDYALVGGTGAATLSGGAGPSLFLTTGANANSLLRHVSGMEVNGSFSRIKFYRAVADFQATIAATFQAFCGIAGIVTNAAINFATDKHIGFKFDPSGSANWFATVSNGAAETTLDTGVAVVVNTDALLAFQYDGVTGTFWVNGVNKGTIATANCPTGAPANSLAMTHYIDNKAVANARNLRIYDALAVGSFV